MLEEKGKLKSIYEGGGKDVCVHFRASAIEGRGESLLECGYRSAEWRGRN